MCCMLYAACCMALHVAGRTSCVARGLACCSSSGFPEYASTSTPERFSSAIRAVVVISVSTDLGGKMTFSAVTCSCPDDSRRRLLAPAWHRCSDTQDLLAPNGRGLVSSIAAPPPMPPTALACALQYLHHSKPSTERKFLKKQLMIRYGLDRETKHAPCSIVCGPNGRRRCSGAHKGGLAQPQVGGSGKAPVSGGFG